MGVSTKCITDYHTDVHPVIVIRMSSRQMEPLGLGHTVRRKRYCLPFSFTFIGPQICEWKVLLQDQRFVTLDVKFSLKRNALNDFECFSLLYKKHSSEEM